MSPPRRQARELAEELKRFQTGRMVEAHAYSFGEHVRRFVHRNRAAVWDVATARSRAEIKRLVRDHVPWRVVGGRLAWVEGRVVRAGAPVAVHG